MNEQAYHVPVNDQGKALNPWAVTVTVAMTTFMEVLDISIANVALRHIAGDLSAGQDEAVWVLTSYMVSNAIILPMSGWLSSLMGRRRFYLASVALFSISSLLCGLAPNLAILILCRTVQGIGGGGLQPSSQAILTDTFAPSRRGLAFAVYGITTVLAPAIGPTLGGWITDHFSWRWIFLINVPVGLLSFYFTTRLVFDPPAFAAQRRARQTDKTFTIDTFGFALLALGIGCLQIALDKGQEDDWFESSFIVTMVALSLLCLVILPFWELRHKNPMVDLRLLADRNFLFSNILMFLLGFVLFGSTVLLPMMVQTLMGYSATEAGMLLSPGGLAVLCTMPIIGIMVGKFDVRHMIAFGLGCNALAMYLFSNIDIQTDFWSMALLRVMQGIGFGFLFVPINTAAFARIAPGKSSNASAIVNLSRNLGGSFGISLIQTYLTQQGQRHQATLVAHVSNFSPNLGVWLQSIDQQGLSAFAPALLAQSVATQASQLAFMDNYRLLSLLTLSFVPVVYLLKRPIPKPAPAKKT